MTGWIIDDDPFAMTGGWERSIKRLNPIPSSLMDTEVKQQRLSASSPRRLYRCTNLTLYTSEWAKATGAGGKNTRMHKYRKRNPQEEI